MTAVLKMNVQELNNEFVEDLKFQFANADVEIIVHEQNETSSTFSSIDFWNLIDQLDWSQEENDEAVVAPLVQYLQLQPLSHIYRFADILAEKLYELDTKSFAKVFLEEEGYLSSDDFLYARCAVVANGKVYFENVLSEQEPMPTDVTFEPLLYVPMKAYKAKTGKDFIFTPAFNFETYSNKKAWL